MIRAYIDQYGELYKPEQAERLLDKSGLIPLVAQDAAQEALDKMAENARDLGLSYEQPAEQEPVASVIKLGAICQWQPERMHLLPDGKHQLYTTPPAPAHHGIPSMCNHNWANGIKNEKWCVLCGKLEVDHFAASGKPMAEQPAPAQEPDPDELTIAYMSGLHEGKKIGAKEERVRFALECIDLVAFYGGPVDLEAAIREKGGAA